MLPLTLLSLALVAPVDAVLYWHVRDEFREQEWCGRRTTRLAVVPDQQEHLVLPGTKGKLVHVWLRAIDEDKVRIRLGDQKVMTGAFPGDEQWEWRDLKTGHWRGDPGP